MKNNIVMFLAATFICVSCSWNEESEYSEKLKAYYQIHSKQQDSIFTGNNADSIGTFGSSSDGQMLSTSVTYPYSVRCDLLIEGKLIVDGGTSTDISDTYVTVKKINVRVWIDGKDSMMVFCPEIDSRVAEPENVLEWETMPECVKYRRKTLSAEPVTITYKDYFYSEVEVCYVLRVREKEFAAGCTADNYWSTVCCGSSSLMEKQMSVLVPLELFTIQFNAIVNT